jgi:metal-sulfur cluster biosynthetic enzyme
MEVSGAIDLPAKTVKTVPDEPSLESVPTPAPAPTYAPPYPPPVNPRISAVAAYPPLPLSGTRSEPCSSKGTTGMEAPLLTIAAAAVSDGALRTSPPPAIDTEAGARSGKAASATIAAAAILHIRMDEGVGDEAKHIMPTVEQVRDALKEVKDPEINLPILDLGLVYDISVEGENGEHVNVVMTLTSPMCPVGPMFKQNVEDAVRAIEGVKTVTVDITFTPPWDPREMATDDVKMLLGIW